MTRQEIEQLARDVEEKERRARTLSSAPWMGKGTVGIALLEYDYLTAKREAEEARAELTRRMEEL